MLTNIYLSITNKFQNIKPIFTRYILYSFALIESFTLPKLIDEYNYSQYEYYKNFIFIFPSILLGAYSGYVQLKYVYKVDYYKPVSYTHLDVYKRQLIALQLEAPAVDQQVCALCNTGFDQFQDIGLGSRRHHRAVVDVIACGIGADLQRLDARDQLGHQRVGGLLANRNRHRNRHAAFACRTETRANQRIGGLVQILSLIHI